MKVHFTWHNTETASFPKYSRICLYYWQTCSQNHIETTFPKALGELASALQFHIRNNKQSTIHEAVNFVSWTFW